MTTPKSIPVPDKYKKAVTSVQAKDDVYQLEDEYDGYETQDSERYEAVEGAFWPTRQITSCQFDGIQWETSPDLESRPTPERSHLLQRIDNGEFALIELNLAEKAAAAVWLACNPVEGQVCPTFASTVPTLHVFADSGPHPLPQMCPLPTDRLVDYDDFPELVDSDDESGGGG